MTQQFQLSTDNLTDSFWLALKEKFPHAHLDIRISSPKNFDGMTEKDFWTIISLFNWANEENDDLVLEKAIIELASKPLRCIYEFQDILSEKLYDLDTRLHASHTGENAWLDNDSDFSADEFLYARCCVVANGKAFYQKVLNNAELMPQNLSFEAILTLAHRAYHLKTGKQFRYVPAYSIETFSNKKGWEN